MNQIVPGTLLISDPFLKDENFTRTVVLICEHDNDGSFGLVINKPYEAHLGDLISGFEFSYFPVFQGGPVRLNTLHFLHQRPDLIESGIALTDGIFWGGNFEQVTELLKKGALQPNDIRFFVGYSGWSENQLQEELDEKSWITRPAEKGLVFTKYLQQIWPSALKGMGGEYSLMANYPLDPQLN